MCIFPPPRLIPFCRPLRGCHNISTVRRRAASIAAAVGSQTRTHGAMRITLRPTAENASKDLDLGEVSFPQWWKSELWPNGVGRPVRLPVYNGPAELDRKCKGKKRQAFGPSQSHVSCYRREASMQVDFSLAFATLASRSVLKSLSKSKRTANGRGGMASKPHFSMASTSEFPTASCSRHRISLSCLPRRSAWLTVAIDELYFDCWKRNVDVRLENWHTLGLHATIAINDKDMQK